MTMTARRGSESLEAPVETKHRDDFVAAMGKAATGVTVVATDGPSGRWAQTVSAMCSVSADPPTVLVCLHVRSPLCEAIRVNGCFSVNVLSAEQAHLADAFAGRARVGEPYNFGMATWTQSVSGAPVIDGAVATFDCELARCEVAGSHMIFLGRVLRSANAPGDSLVYQSRTYGRHRALEG
jgi:flavin reductase